MKPLYAVASILVFANTVHAQSAPTLSAAATTQIDSVVMRTMARIGVPAVSIAVVKNNTIVLERAYGSADIENYVPATTASVFRIASVAKPITATAVMQLVDKGLLRLDAPIQDYVPDFPAKQYPVTLRDLLTHTSGLRHYAGDEWNNTRPCKELREGLAVFSASPLEHKPGEKMTYSTYGYVLLGLAIEKASGLSFMDYLHKNIFVPAKMIATRKDVVTELIPRRVDGYAVDENGVVRNSDLADTSCKIPGGGLVSTASDLARFVSAFTSGSLVPKQVIADMTTNRMSNDQWLRTVGGVMPAGFTPPGIGYGWAIGLRQHRSVVWHGGNQQGATSLMSYLPEQGLGLVVLTNVEAQGSAVEDLGSQIYSILIR